MVVVADGDGVDVHISSTLPNSDFSVASSHSSEEF